MKQFGQALPDRKFVLANYDMTQKQQKRPPLWAAFSILYQDS